MDQLVAIYSPNVFKLSQANATLALAQLEASRAQILAERVALVAKLGEVVQEAALAQCWKHGGRAFMADQGEILPDDPEDPMRTTMRQMMGVFAQLDRGMTVAKLRRGRRIKGEQGKYAYGAPPYGWQAHKKELTLVEMEQAGRARARQLRDEDELSYREIAAVLDAEGLRPKRGERWHPETVRRMPANPSDRPPTLRRRERTA
jgi:hypothetical protein